MPQGLQSDLSAGELAPLLHGRVDADIYAKGLARCRNCFIHPLGGAMNRAGFYYDNYNRLDTYRVRYILFSFNAEQNYLLEFGNGYIRVIKDHGNILNTPVVVTDVTEADPAVMEASNHNFTEGTPIYVSGVEYMTELNGRTFYARNLTSFQATITGISLANPCVVTAVNGFSAGQVVYIEDVVGTTEINDQLYKIANPSGADFELTDLDGNAIDSSSWTAWISGGTATRKIVTLYDRDGNGLDASGFTAWSGIGYAASYFEIASPYVESDLPFIKITQSGDEMRLWHPNHQERKLIRLAHDDWTLSLVTHVPVMAAPTSVAAAPSSSNGAYYLSAGAAAGPYPVSAVGATNPATVTLANGPVGAASNVFWNGDRVGITGALGNTAVNNIDGNANPDGYVLKNASGAGPVVYELYKLDGTAVDGSGWSAYTANSAQIGHYLLRYKVTAISATTGEESLPSAASAAKASDPISPEHVCHVTWTAPVGGNVREYRVYREQNGVYGYVGTATTNKFTDVGTAPDLSDTPPSNPARNPFSAVITGITTASPGVVTTQSPHGFQNGHRVAFSEIVGMVDLNGTFAYARDVTDTTFSIYDVDGNPISTTLMTAYASGGYASDWPFCGTYHEQRLIRAGQTNNVQRVHASGIGNTDNMNVHFPAQDDDAFSWILPSGRVNAIRHAVSLDNLFFFTSGGVWVCRADGAFTFVNLRNREQATTGCSHIPPIIAKDKILYVDDKGDDIWDMDFTFETDKYHARQLSIRASHLFEGKTVVDWAFQGKPYRILWMVMSDGTLNCLTYVPDENVFAMYWYDTQGKFESVCVVPENGRDEVYVSVLRNIDGTPRRMREHLHWREVEDVQDSFFVDSGLSLNLPLPVSGTVLAEHGIVNVPAHNLEVNDQIDVEGIVGTVEINDLRFRVARVDGDAIYLTEDSLEEGISVTDISNADPGVVTTGSNHGLADGDVVRLSSIDGMDEVNNKFFSVNVLTSSTFALYVFGTIVHVDTTSYGTYTADSIGTVQKATALDMTGFGDYLEGGNVRKVADSVSGLNHLEGMEVAILANGSVQNPQTVVNGRITLDDPASRVHVGLAYTSQIITLPLETQSGALAGRKRSNRKLIAKTWRTRGFLAGPPSGQLREFPQRYAENFGAPTEWKTGEIEIHLAPGWDDLGQVLIEQSDPIPLTVLGIVPVFEVGS